MKRLVLGILVLGVIGTIITGCSQEKVKKVEKTHSKERYLFYKKENENRYKNYQKEHKELTEKEVIIHVNIGLDQPYYTNTNPSSNLNTKFVLVNKYFYLEEDYVPDHLVELDTTYSKGGIFLVQEAVDHFKELVDAAKKEGLSVRAISAYRSYNYQVNLYNRYMMQDGKEAADTYSARPGFSEHQTGLCVDVDDRVKDFTDFEETESFQWMQEHAYQYGFILRFPKEKENITGYHYESWHYRYVGVEIATYMKEHNLTFDEYYMEFLEKEVE